MVLIYDLFYIAFVSIHCVLTIVLYLFFSACVHVWMYQRQVFVSRMAQNANVPAALLHISVW